MVRVNPKGSEQTTSVPTRSSNQTNAANVQSMNDVNIVQGTNDLAQYYAELAKQYAEKAAIDVNIAIGNALLNITGTGNIKPIYSDGTLIIRDAQFKYEQAIASSEWTINHNLGKRPSAVIVDSSGNQFRPAVEHIDDNTCVLSMLGATTGTAYLN